MKSRGFRDAAFLDRLLRDAAEAASESPTDAIPAADVPTNVTASTALARFVFTPDYFPESAPLPPADQFQPPPHGDEATAAGLNPEALAKIDVEMQRHIAAL